MSVLLLLLLAFHFFVGAVVEKIFEKGRNEWGESGKREQRMDD